MTDKKMFEVRVRQGVRTVIATRFAISEGDLVFCDGKDIFAAFASGEWETVNEIRTKPEILT